MTDSASGNSNPNIPAPPTELAEASTESNVVVPPPPPADAKPQAPIPDPVALVKDAPAPPPVPQVQPNGPNQPQKMAHRLKIPIAFKLTFITVLLMLSATVPIALRSSHLFEKESGKREEDTNRDQAKTVGDEVQEAFKNFIDKSKLVGSILYKTFPSEENREQALDLSFRTDKDLVAVEVIAVAEGRPLTLKRVVNEEYLKQYDLKTDYIDNLRSVKPFPVQIPLNGDIEIRNSTIEGGAPLLTLGVPMVRDEFGNITTIVLADIRLDRIQKIFSSVSERTIYLIDREGHVLAHPNEKLALTGKKLDAIPIVSLALTKKVAQFQTRFEDEETEERFVAAFVKTPYGATVISQVPEAVILEPSQFVRRQAFLITGVVLSSAFFFIILFSATLTRPLEVLVSTTKEVAQGNLEARTHLRTSDEVGELAEAFDQMVDGLRERDKVKTLFNKFHGTGVASQLISGEIKLGGEQREATVFFSDIRGFTSFSEKISPQQVVDMLNEYFKIMVGIINTNHGVVDKFIGDAIMAVWGAPESHGNDAVNAIKACIEMRVALEKLNDERMARGESEVKIGMGLHSGPLIAGTIGSDDRMEYTVIGDTVNMASRIEAATKAYGTDLLISEVTYELVKEYFTVEQAGSAVVKGKSEPLKLFKVTGYFDESGKPVEVKTRYSHYEAESADKVKVA